MAAGRAHAGGMQDTLGQEMAAAGLLRILYTSRLYPTSLIAAAPDLDAEVLNRVGRALLDFEPTGRHAEGLYNWHKTEMPHGFLEARDEDYEELRLWARDFGLLEPPSGAGS